MSTTRTASIRGFGGSQSNNAGVSPVLTARQKAFSAAIRICLVDRSASIDSSTHLPPPLMMETRTLGTCDQHVC